MMKICMFVYNNCKYDSRVLKEAKTLADAGFDVRIIAVLDQETVPFESMHGFRIIRVPLNPLHYRILRRLQNFQWRELWRSIRAPKSAPTEAEQDNMTATGASAPLQPAAEPVSQPLKRRYPEFLKPLKPLYLIYRKSFRPLLIWLYKRCLSIPVFLYRAISRRITSAIYQLFRWLLLQFNMTFYYEDFYARCYRIVEAEPADLYHAHDFNTLPLACRIKRRMGGKIVYDAHELFSETKTLTRMQRITTRIRERWLIHHADQVITVCESIGHELVKRYGITFPVIVLNCPYRANKNILTASQLLRGRLGIDDKTHIILFQGGIGPFRALPNLIRAAHYLEDGIIVFMGWGSLETQMKELVISEKLSERVKFTPPVPYDELIQNTATADLGVVALEFDGLNNYYATPNKLFEYIAAGLPVVSSDFPELKRVIEGHELGKTFDPEDPKEIAAAIRFVLSDRERYERMRRNSLEAAKIFNWEIESNKLLDLYKRLT
ncbi:glycosyltransferase family 4 protein [Candidatus Acetothermia bacterium]|nr:glycosyltransferase family 4 protein [Candidatus Acetothermia bacterium]